MKRSGLLDHLRGLMEVATDPAATLGLRTEYARQAAEQSADMRDALRAAVSAGSGARVLELVQSRNLGEAMERENQRRDLGLELRDLGDYPGLLPTYVAPTGGTGYGPMPLIRTVAGSWSESLLGLPPIIPGFVAGGEAEVDPDLEVTVEGDPMGVVDVSQSAETRHWSILTFEASKQLADWLTRDGAALLDQAVLDSIDLAAEKFIAAALIATAGGARAAGADLGAALDEAESAASGRGLVEYVVVNAMDLPAVRRVLASTHFDSPHPTMHVSAGQPSGTATFVGRRGVLLRTSEYETQSVQMVRAFMTSAAVARPFLLQVREDVLVQTVTGIGA